MNKTNKTWCRIEKPKTLIEMRKQEFEQSSNVDCVLSKTYSCKGESQLYNLEMITEGRSPTLRRVSGTHRDALDWMFVGIDLEHKIKIKYVYTKNKLADMLNTGSCSREWNHLLRLFNIMSRCFLATFLAIFFLIRSESRAPCQRKVRMRLPVKVHQWQSQNQRIQQRRDQSTFFFTARGARGKIFHRTWDLQSIRGPTIKDKVI